MRLFAFIFLLSSITASAQFNIQEVVDPSDLEWGDGSILLNDGTELKGLIKYNDRAGILSFESGSTSRSFTSRKVSGFEFYDEREKKQRIFILLYMKTLKQMRNHLCFLNSLKI